MTFILSWYISYPVVGMEEEEELEEAVMRDNSSSLEFSDASLFFNMKRTFSFIFDIYD